MYKPVLLHLSHFMSHKETLFEFIANAVMVYGVNKTDEGQISNGSGKSAILEGLSLSLIGNTLRKVSAKDLVMRGHKVCTVDLVLQGVEDNIRIRRIIYSNTKSSELMIKVNNETPKELVINADDKVDVNNGNKWILKKLGISREDLLNFFLISKEKYIPFLSTSDTNKKGIIDRFSQSNLVDPVFDELELMVNGLDTKIANLDSKKSINIGKIELLREQIESDTQENWKNANRLAIDSLKRRITIEKESSDAIEIEVLNWDKEANDLEETVAKIDIESIKSNFQKAKVNLENHISGYRQNEKDLNETLTLLNQTKNKIAGIIKCPKCKYEFVLEENVDIPSTKSLIDDLTGIHKELNSLVEAATIKGKDLRTHKNNLENRVNTTSENIRKSNNKITNLRKNVEDGLKNIESNELKIIQLQNSIKDIENKKYAPEHKVKQDQIKDLEALNVGIDNDIVDIKNEIEVNKEWVGHMKRFKAHLSNKSIKAIETIANDYLDQMKTSLSLRIEGFKINKSGEIREKITAHVLRDGVEEGLFEQFSTGEKARIEVAMILALQALINLNSDTGLDLCFLDEVADGLDSEGLVNLMKVLNTLQQPVVVISHGSMDRRVENRVEIQKINGVSCILAD